MKVIDVDVFESALDFADADVCEESPDGYCSFGFSRERIKELLRDIPDYRSPCEVERDEKSLAPGYVITGDGPDDWSTHKDRFCSECGMKIDWDGINFSDITKV